MQKKALILLRGLPGAGKSSLAQLLSEKGKYPIFAIDDYFTDKLTSKYHFDFSKNYLAYQQCESLTNQAMQSGTEKVFIDNAFTLSWEMEPYFKLAAKHNYLIYIITVEKHHNNKNIHNISQEQIEKMATKYKVKLL